MKKTTRIFGILLIAAMLLGLLAMTASAATVERMDGFTVKVTDLVYTTDGSSISSANFHSISYKVVNSTTIRFTYSVWLYEGAGSGGSSRADQTATLNNYSCTEDIDVKIPMTYSNGGGKRNWTYNLSVTKAAGHIYTNACDTSCNVCGETRTITHNYNNGICTVCGEVCKHTEVSANGLCAECKMSFVASVNGTYFTSIDEAFALANETADAKLVLLQDVVISQVEMKGTFTLDLNGHTLGSVDDYQYSLNITGGHLTIQDSVGTGAILANAKDSFIGVYNSASFTVTGGTFSEVIANTSGSVTVTGGKFVEFSTQGSGTKASSGGEFGVLWTNPNPIEAYLATDYFVYNENGEPVNVCETRIVYNVTVRKGADLKYAVVTANNTAYTGLAQKPTVTVAVAGRELPADKFSASYADNIEMGTGTVTVTGNAPYSGTNSTTFEITKGNLAVATNPETTYEFGAAAGDEVYGGKVVIEGNESAVITGTWAWVKQGQTAVFTPAAEFENLFNELTNVNVTHVVTPATPVIEVITPSPSIMPGMAIRMSVVVKNPHNGELTDLPTAFRVTYKIGENGTPVTVSGLEFTLPAATALGETVYVWVENVAVDGKYAVATSTNTIELAVGQVDYTKNIDEVKAALQAEIDALEEIIAALEETHGADVTALQERVAALEAAVAALDSTYATDEALNAAVTTLNERIDGLSDEIEALANVYATIEALNAAKQELQEAINNNETDIEAKVAALTEALEKAQTALENAYKAADATLKSELEALIATTKTELNAAIEKVKSDLQKELADAVAKLNAADKENADALAAAIEELNKAIEAAKKFATDEDAKLKEALEKADAALDAAIKQVQDNLDKAVEDLNAADKENADALAAAIEELNKAIEAAQAAAEAGDAAIRNELASAKASLNASINAVARDLAAAKSSLMSAINSGDAALSKKIEALDAALTAAIAANAAADEATKAELTALIQETNAALQAAIDKVAADLAAAEVALNKAIANGDKALDEKIAALNTALEAAIAASNAADETLTAEMNKAVDALNKAIAQVQKNLDDAKAELVAKDEVMTAELERLNTFVIVVCVIAGTALCGCGVLVYFVFFGKRKLI